MPDTNPEYYLIRDTGKIKTVAKMAVSPTGSIEKKAEYTVINNFCNCQSYTFRKDCKHVDMTTSDFIATSVTLSDARQEVRKVTDLFHKHYRFSGMTPQPYERDENGMVTRASIVLRYPFEGVGILGIGLWDGVLTSRNLLMRLIVEAGDDR